MGIVNPNGGGRQQAGQRPTRVIPFGKYLLLERIAVGGMAEVYMAKSFGIEGFEKILAIKRILPTMAEDSDFIEMFIDEAKIAGQLSHANICPIFELGKIGESHYIAMEYVWGKDLLQIMNRFRRLRKKMPPAMVAWTASKMCEALDYAHHKRDRKGRPLNIIHRDVSPQNILVSYEGEVKIIDFGIAKAASRTTKTQAGVLKGKFGYMSPEQVRGLPIDHRSDIFAVGTCMYEALTSERLFMGESDFSTLEKVRNADVAPLSAVASEIPSDLTEVVMKALQRDPVDRFQSAGEFQEALQHFLARQRPPFGTSKLSAWLKTAFATEMTREKARLDSFAHIGRPSVLSGARRSPSGPPGQPARATFRPPPRAAALPPVPRPGPDTSEISASELEVESIEDDDFGGDQTMITASPFDSDGPVEGQLSDEPTQIFFSADDVEEVVDGQPPRVAPSVGTGTPRVMGPVSFVPGQVTPQPMIHVGGGAPGFPMPVPSPAQGIDMFAASAQAAVSVPPPAGGYVSQPPHGAQRSMRTSMDLAPVAVAQPVKSSLGGRAIALAAVLIVLLLAASVTTTLLLVDGEKVGTIEIRTVPAVGTAAVLIDDVPRGSAPLRVERIPAGQRIIEVRAEGFQPALRRVNVQPGTTAMLEVALTAEAAEPTSVGAVAQADAPAPGEPGEAPGEGSATAAPASNDDRNAAATAEREQQARAQQEREARAQQERDRAESPAAPAQATTMTPVRVPRDTQQNPVRPPPDPTTMAPTSAEPARGTGTLVINSLPWARVFVDGRDTGRNTPVPSLRVPAGTRRVGLRTPDGQMHTFPVEVEAGATVRLSKRL